MELPSVATASGPNMKVITQPKCSSTLKSEVEMDAAFENSGSFGRFQFLVQIVMTYLFMMVGYQSVMSYFIANDPAWRCRSNETSSFCGENFGVDITSDDDRFSHRCLLDRMEWTYTTNRKYSFLTEFDLVCSKTSVAALTSGIFHIGGAFGLPVTGIIADRYGRKFTLLLCLVLMSAFSFASCYVSNMTQLIILRGCLGATSWSCNNIGFVYLGEFIPPKYRTISANIYCLGFPLSELFIDVLAYYVREWRRLQVYASLPCLITFIFLFVLPKSPRWLMSNNEKMKAETVLEKIGKFNGKPLSSISLKSAISSATRKCTYREIFTNRKVVSLTLSQGLIWFSISMTFYMLSLQSSNLGGNMYAAFALSALSEIPSTALATYACSRYGRKRTILMCLVLAGAFIGATIFIPKNFASRFTLNMVFLMFAKFFINTSLLGNMIWTFEIYPTVLRLQGWGICIGFERLGSFTAPFLTSVLHNLNPILPYLTVMIFVFCAAAGGLYLPETNKMPTRENFEDFFHTAPDIREEDMNGNNI